MMPNTSYKYILHLFNYHSIINIKSDSKEVIEINNMDILNKIIFYTATPMKLWSTYKDKDDVKDYEIFKELYVINIEEHYNIIRSKYYYGIRDCELKLYESIDKDDFTIPETLPESIIKECNYTDEKDKLEWYTKGSICFDLGDELKFIHTINNILPQLNINWNIFMSFINM